MKLAESKYVEGVQIIPHHLSETFLLSLFKNCSPESKRQSHKENELVKSDIIQPTAALPNLMRVK